MKHLSTPASITLALIIHTYVNGGQAQEIGQYQPSLNEFGQPELQGTWFFGSTTPVTPRAISGIVPPTRLRKLRLLSPRPCKPTSLRKHHSTLTDQHRNPVPTSVSKQISISQQSVTSATRCSVNFARHW